MTPVVNEAKRRIESLKSRLSWLKETEPDNALEHMYTEGKIDAYAEIEYWAKGREDPQPDVP